MKNMVEFAIHALINVGYLDSVLEWRVNIAEFYQVRPHVGVKLRLIQGAQNLTESPKH